MSEDDAGDEARVHWNKNWLAIRSGKMSHRSQLAGCQVEVARLEGLWRELRRFLHSCQEGETASILTARSAINAVLSYMDELEGNDADI